MSRETIKTQNAPAAIGPYSQGVKVGNLIFTSGQLPIDPVTGELISNDIRKATERAILNVKAILDEAGSSLDKVVKTVIYVKNMNDFTIVNEVYGKYFTGDAPARSCVEVSKLPKDGVIEIEVVAEI